MELVASGAVLRLPGDSPPRGRRYRWTHAQPECVCSSFDTCCVSRLSSGLNVCTSGSSASCEDCLLIHPSCAWCAQEVRVRGSAAPGRRSRRSVS